MRVKEELNRTSASRLSFDDAAIYMSIIMHVVALHVHLNICVQEEEGLLNIQDHGQIYIQRTVMGC